MSRHPLPHWDDISSNCSVGGGGGRRSKARQSICELDRYTRRNEKALALTESDLFHFDSWSTASDFSSVRNTPYVSKAYGAGTEVYDFMLRRDWGVPTLAKTSDEINHASDAESEIDEDVLQQPASDMLSEVHKDSQNTVADARPHAASATQQARSSSKKAFESLAIVAAKHCSRMHKEAQELLSGVKAIENSLDTTSEIDDAVLAIIKSLPRAWKKQTDKDVLEIEKLYTNIYQPSLLELAKVENGESLTEVVEDVLTPDEKRELETAGCNLLGLESVLSVFPVAFAGILDGVARIMESQKKIYFSQLKCSKDAVEQAMKGSMSSIRTEAARALNDQAKNFEMQKEQIAELHRRDLFEADKKIAAANALCEELLKGLHVPLHDGRGDMLARRDAVLREQEEKKRAILVEQAQKRFDVELEQATRRHQQELSSVARLNAEKIQLLTESYEQQMRDLQESAAEHTRIVANDRDELRDECEKLKDALSKLAAKAAADKKANENQYEIELKAVQQDLHEALGEVTKAKAQAKADRASLVLKQQTDMHKFKDEFEAKVIQIRSDLQANHSLEMDHVTQLFQSDIKRVEAHADLRRREELAAVKSLHEAEIRRLLRECERTKRVVARAGGIVAINDLARQVERDPLEIIDPDPEPSFAPPNPTPRASLLSQVPRKHELFDVSGFSDVPRDNNLFSQQPSLSILKSSVSEKLDTTIDEVETTIADMELRLNMLGSSHPVNPKKMPFPSATTSFKLSSPHIDQKLIKTKTSSQSPKFHGIQHHSGDRTDLKSVDAEQKLSEMPKSLSPSSSSVSPEVSTVQISMASKESSQVSSRRSSPAPDASYQGSYLSRLDDYLDDLKDDEGDRFGNELNIECSKSDESV